MLSKIIYTHTHTINLKIWKEIDVKMIKKNIKKFATKI